MDELSLKWLVGFRHANKKKDIQTSGKVSAKAGREQCTWLIH